MGLKAVLQHEWKVVFPWHLGGSVCSIKGQKVPCQAMQEGEKGDFGEGEGLFHLQVPRRCQGWG